MNATEQMMYRHFITKEELFEQAVFAPFAEFVAEFEQRVERGLSDEQLARDYVTMFFGFLWANRSALI